MYLMYGIYQVQSHYEVLYSLRDLEFLTLTYCLGTASFGNMSQADRDVLLDLG